MPTQNARIELRIATESKHLLERAAALSNQSLTAFVTEVALARARSVVEGPHGSVVGPPRPIGGWSFALPEGWDEPLDELAEYR